MLVLALAALLAGPADLAAVGIILSPRPAGSAAVLRAGGRSRVVGVGDSAFGGRVVSIGPASVVLDFEGEVREVRLSSAALPAPAAAMPSGAPVAAAEDPDAPNRSMERREVQRRLGQEVPRILAETTLVPVTDGGRQVGFTLSRIPEGTLLTDAGLQAGDVLTEVNNTPIDSLATLMGLWPRLQTESTLRAVVLRNGRPISLTVRLR